jgi:K+-sensing histidine kinase KdpD
MALIGAYVYETIGQKIPFTQLSQPEEIRGISTFLHILAVSALVFVVTFVVEIINTLMMIIARYLRNFDIMEYIKTGAKFAIVFETAPFPIAMIMASIYDKHMLGLPGLIFFSLIFGVAVLIVKRLMNTRHNLKMYVDRLKIVNRVSQAISSLLKRDKIIELIYQQCKEFVDVSNFEVALYYEERKELEFMLAYKEGKPINNYKLELVNSLSGLVIEKKQPILIKNLNELEDEVIKSKAIFQKESFMSYLSVPMIYKDRVYGLITVKSHQSNAFKESEMELLSTFAYQSAIAIENANLYQELEDYKNELQEALGNVKKLSGLLPICASCKKIRDDKGYWHQVEAYIKEHSEASFSHGVCPECAKQMLDEFRKGKL